MRAKPIEVTKSHLAGLQKLLKYFNTQSDIADSLQISRQAVGHWFSGRKVISFNQARRLVMMLNNQVTLDDLRPDFTKILKKDLQRAMKHVY